jgi:hypothetical protein
MSEAVDTFNPPSPAVSNVNCDCDEAGKVGFLATMSHASTSALPLVDQAKAQKMSSQYDKLY